ncbi:hypothetical protein VPHK567_0301 [Vibrio phage K567]
MVEAEKFRLILVELVIFEIFEILGVLYES